ncbi:MAG: homocysteine S-methyltransferase family protein, partial [Candidatus Aenigmarchaeota archaeon]|nr:homocysteine S-methyltransferase family protein [Candidatus Aenigmarchaeota archaeon]
MKRDEFKELLQRKILILDGAMGTTIMKMGITVKCNELLNLTNRDIIKKIHGGYADAGSDIIFTNTFGANRLKLEVHGYGEKTVEINEEAVKLAREACPDCLIAGDIGPLGKYIEPLGDLTFDKAYDYFSEQISGLKKADLLTIETFSDVKMFKAAILAAKDNCNLPIMTTMTFQGGRTDIGTDVETYATIADSLDVDTIGANCSEGPEGLLEVAKILVKNTNKPISIKPNAGIPKIVNNQTIYPQTPEEFSSFAEKFYRLGVNLLGGCCGTNDQHIRKIAEKLKGKKPLARKIIEKTNLCSRRRTITIEGKTLVVGERINPTNKK